MRYLPEKLDSSMNMLVNEVSILSCINVHVFALSVTPLSKIDHNSSTYFCVRF